MIQLRLFYPHRSSAIAQTEEAWRVRPEISGGGLFFDLAPHQLDILLFLFGDPVRSFGIPAHQTTFYSAEDTVTGLIKFPNQVLFSGSWCFTMPETMQEDSCLVIGEKGTLRFSVFGGEYQLETEKGTAVFQPPVPKHIQEPMIRHVVRYFLGEQGNPCSAQEALKSLEVMEGFIRSSSTLTPD